MLGIQVTGGTVLGSSHQEDRKNNQDAFYFRSTEKIVAGFVADGCGSSAFSEFGARIGARLATELMISHYDCFTDPVGHEEFIAKRVTIDMRDRITTIVKMMGPESDHGRILVEHFLFTLVGFVVTPYCAVIYTLGDGSYKVNTDPVVNLGPFPNNTPPYLAYGLLKSSIDPAECFIKPATCISNFESIIVGTDGIGSITTEFGDGALTAFTQDRMFKNTDMVRRRLWQLNENKVNVNWDNRTYGIKHGALDDDTTLIVVRKVP